MITTATAQGRRPYQEDRFFISEGSEGILFGVLDGHRGATVSDILSKQLPGFWSVFDGLDYSQALLKTFEMAHSMTGHFNEGSTASVVFIPTHKKMAYIAVLGDSPIIVEKADGTLFIGPDHNARSNFEERSAAIARGGYYSEGYMWAPVARFSDNGAGLQMTRAFGDTSCCSFLSRVPEVFTISLGDWLLVGSDGLLDPTHTTTNPTGEFIEEILAAENAQELVDRAIRIPTRDNVTAILWRRK